MIFLTRYYRKIFFQVEFLKVSKKSSLEKKTDENYEIEKVTSNFGLRDFCMAQLRRHVTMNFTNIFVGKKYLNYDLIDFRIFKIFSFEFDGCVKYGKQFRFGLM